MKNLLQLELVLGRIEEACAEFFSQIHVAQALIYYCTACYIFCILFPDQLNIPAVNKDVWGTEALTLTIRRGKTGYGFSVIEACPVRVGRVDGKSPAEAAGLHPGDIIIRLNKQNVSRSTATSVAKLIK